MTSIHLITFINAPIEKCFDLARDVDVHQLSALGTNEKAIAGRRSGLCELNDEITWEATHFGIRQRLQVKITAMHVPHFFEDRMLKGAFKSIKHGHFFSTEKSGTLMKDVFEYTVPYGWIGRIFDRLILRNNMIRFLEKRNAILKEIAESLSQV